MWDVSGCVSQKRLMQCEVRPEKYHMEGQGNDMGIVFPRMVEPCEKVVGHRTCPCLFLSLTR